MVRMIGLILQLLYSMWYVAVIYYVTLYDIYFMLHYLTYVAITI